MIERIRTIIAGGWFAAWPFVLLGAQPKWQWLSMGVGAALTFILTTDRQSKDGATQQLDGQATIGYQKHS